MTLASAAAACSVLLAGALAALLVRRPAGAPAGLGTVSAALACLLLVVGAGHDLVNGAPAEDLRAAWSLPVGQLHLRADGLSRFFLLCLGVVSGLAAVYGIGYLRAHAPGRSLGPYAALFNLLVASMVLVLLAGDAVLFLAGWEVMTVASYFLVTFDDHEDDVRRAGFTYLIASHLGAIVVFLFFGLIGRESGGTYDFAALARPHAWTGVSATTCMVLAVVGFGVKAGLWPVHVWLPDAHPAAPSHVSAVLSGVMVKMGAYGLLRALTFLGPPAWSWGAALAIVGGVSALVGAMHSAAERDLKRLLAYSTVKNAGVVAMGIGIGVLGRAGGRDDVAVLGFSGALLHVLAHGVHKSLLFSAAGAVVVATRVRQLDRLGGLARRMPWTAGTFLVGACSASALPPLAGFTSEWLIYVGALRAAASSGGAGIGVAVIALLALVGGLAALALLKAFGVAFLGEPRDPTVGSAPEEGGAMRWPLVVGAAICVAVGIAPAAAVRLVADPTALLAGPLPLADVVPGSLPALARLGAVLLGTAGALVLLRRALLQDREVAEGSTWACGYPATSTRTQYTAASFTQPVLDPVGTLLRRRVRTKAPEGFFPRAAVYEESHSDFAGERLLVPAIRRGLTALGGLRRIQHGRLHLYILYILVTLIALLAWNLGGERLAP